VSGGVARERCEAGGWAGVGAISAGAVSPMSSGSLPPSSPSLAANTPFSPWLAGWILLPLQRGKKEGGAPSPFFLTVASSLSTLAAVVQVRPSPSPLI
jgi:hypothetical protein